MDSQKTPAFSKDSQDSESSELSEIPASESRTPEYDQVSQQAPEKEIKQYELTALDIHYLLKELSNLIGAKVDRIYQGSENKREFLFAFHQQGAGKVMLRISPPGLLYITKNKGAFPQQPPGYCMFLRKYLGSTRLSAVRQHSFERIIELVFSGKDNKEHIMVVELFSKGNLVLCEQDYKIRSPLENQNWRDRTIRGGIHYIYPPAQTDTKSISEQEFAEKAKNLNKEVVKFLARDMSLGGVYAEELCHLTGIDKKKTGLADEQASLLFKGLKSMFEMEPNPCITDSRAFPFLIHSLTVEKQGFSSFSEALDSIIPTPKNSSRLPGTEGKKLQGMIGLQEQRISELESQAVELKRKAELLYENYAAVSLIFETIRELRKERKSWAEIRKSLKEHAFFVSIDETKEELVIDTPDVTTKDGGAEYTKPGIPPSQGVHKEA